MSRLHGRGYEVISTEVCPLCKGKGKSKSVDFMKISEKDIDSFLKMAQYVKNAKAREVSKLPDPVKPVKGLENLYLQGLWSKDS